MAIKDFLQKQRASVEFEMYKFIGDGWVLLFKTDVPARKLADFLQELCKKYDALFAQKIKPVLSTQIPIVGITFGLDKGTLVRVVMNQQVEYIGRPLNVAARLQSAIKEKDPNPQGKVLISNNAYDAMESDLRNRFRVDNVTRTLRNISGGTNYLAKKLWLFKGSKK